MNRHRLDALQQQDGRLYFNGVPYEGIAYEIVGDRVVANHRVGDGWRGRPAETWDETRERVLQEALDQIEPPEPSRQYPMDGYYFSGVLYQGVAYHFDKTTGVLLREEDYRFDPPGRSREWFASGVLKRDTEVVRPDGSEVSESYYPNGRVSTCLAEKIRWGQTEHQRLRNLYLEPGYSETEFLFIPMIVDTDLLGLTGKGITNETLKRFARLEDLAKLHLSTTAVTAKGLDVLRSCTHLRQLLLYPNNEFSEEDARNFVASIPNCVLVVR